MSERVRRRFVTVAAVLSAALHGVAAIALLGAALPPEPADVLQIVAPVALAARPAAALAVPEPVTDEPLADRVRSRPARRRSEAPAMRPATEATEVGEPVAAVRGAVDAAPAPDPLDDWRRAVWWHLAAHPPKAARGAGLAVIAFTLSADGELAELSVARSSGRAAFDRACLAAVRAAAPFPAPPREAASRDMSFEISIRALGMGSPGTGGVYANAD